MLPDTLGHLFDIPLRLAPSSVAVIQGDVTLTYADLDGWCNRAANALAGGSPTSASLIWELHRRAVTLSLADVLRLELVVAMQCCAHPDFREGVRALLIEKGTKPRWTPERLQSISPQWLAEHFREPAWPGGQHPLHNLN